MSCQCALAKAKCRRPELSVRKFLTISMMQVHPAAFETCRGPLKCGHYTQKHVQHVQRAGKQCLQLCALSDSWHLCCWAAVTASCHGFLGLAHTAGRSFVYPACTFLPCCLSTASAHIKMISHDSTLLSSPHMTQRTQESTYDAQNAGMHYRACT